MKERETNAGSNSQEKLKHINSCMSDLFWGVLTIFNEKA